MREKNVTVALVVYYILGSGDHVEYVHNEMQYNKKDYGISRK